MNMPYGLVEIGDYFKWQKRRQNPNLPKEFVDGLRVLVVGGGSVGKRYVGNLLGLGLTHVAVVEPRKDRQDDIRTHYGELEMFETEDKAYDGKTYDIVIVANPPVFHIASGMNAIAHGAHVLMEKCISPTIDGVEEFLTAADKAGKIVGMCYISRFFDTLQYIKKMIDSGALGKVYSVQINSTEYLPEWHPWEKPEDWYASQKKLGGGVLKDENHTVDFARWLFGEVKSVSGYVGRIANVSVDSDDFTEFTCFHESGTISHIHQDAFGRKARKDMWIMAEKGNLYWDSYVGGNKVEYYNADTRTTEIVPGKVSRSDAFFELVRDFLEAVHTGKQPFITGWDGLKTLKVDLAVEESSAGKKSTEVK